MKKDTKKLLLLAVAALVLVLIVVLAHRGAGKSAAEQAAEDTVPPETAEASATAAAPAEDPAGTAAVPEYAELLFDTSAVHTIDIRVPDGDWQELLDDSSESIKEYIDCAMVIDGELVENVSIRSKGHSSLSRSKSTEKYSFKVEFDHTVEGGSYHGLDKLSLNNLVADSTCMHDYIVYRLMGQFGVAAPLCSYAFLTVNGEDFGLYLAVEAVEDAFLVRNFGSEHGALYKPDTTTGSNRGFNGNSDVKLKYIDDNPESYPNIFGTAKAEASRKDEYRLIESLRRLNACEELDQAVDFERVIRYFVVHSFVYNWDSYTGSSVHNYYLYEQDGLLSMIPWDYNEAFGSGGAGVNHPIDTPVTSGTVEERPMLAWIFSDPAYTALYHERYADFLDAFCDSGRAAAEIASVKALIGPYVQRDPRGFYSYEAFETGSNNLATYFELRAQSVRGQLEGTIPSTSEGQAADSSALIDTSALGGSASGERRSSRNRDASGETARENSRSASRESSRGASGESSGGASGESPAGTADGTGSTEPSGEGA